MGTDKDIVIIVTSQQLEHHTYSPDDISRWTNEVNEYFSLKDAEGRTIDNIISDDKDPIVKEYEKKRSEILTLGEHKLHKPETKVEKKSTGTTKKTKK